MHYKLHLQITTMQVILNSEHCNIYLLQLLLTPNHCVSALLLNIMSMLIEGYLLKWRLIVN